MFRAFYTVLGNGDTEPYYVKYIDPDDLRVKRFRYPTLPFADAGEAAQEFQACIGHDLSHYLEPALFQAKVAGSRKLRRRLRQERHEQAQTPKQVEPIV